MSIVSILSSLNIIGLIAFLITLGFLLYEIILLSRAKKPNDLPQVPSFQEGANPLPPTLQIKENKWHPIKNLTRNNKILLITLSILLLFFGSFTLIGSLVDEREVNKVTLITPTRAIAINIAPTKIVPTKLTSSPTPALVFFEEPTETTAEGSVQEPTVKPTEVILVQEISPTAEATEEPVTATESPGVITQLPVTSYLNNSLILLAVGGLFFIFSFLL